MGGGYQDTGFGEMIQFLAIFLWAFWGSDGEQWEYHLAETPYELAVECGNYQGGCATPDKEIWVLSEHRYLPSNYACLTVEEHEQAHALGYSHGDMASLCMWDSMKQYQLMYPTNNIEHLRQMALKQ